jgi:hypothetical protein
MAIPRQLLCRDNLRSFSNVGLFGVFRSSLVAGGYLYIETFGGHGKNYLDLPKAGQLQGLLSKDFHLPFYRERKVGPADYDAVAVKLFAQKRSPLPTPGSTDGP